MKFLFILLILFIVTACGGTNTSSSMNLVEPDNGIDEVSTPDVTDDPLALKTSDFDNQLYVVKLGFSESAFVFYSGGSGVRYDSSDKVLFTWSVSEGLLTIGTIESSDSLSFLSRDENKISFLMNDNEEVTFRKAKTLKKSDLVGKNMQIRPPQSCAYIYYAFTETNATKKYSCYNETGIDVFSEDQAEEFKELDYLKNVLQIGDDYWALIDGELSFGIFAKIFNPDVSSSIEPNSSSSFYLEQMQYF